MLNNFFYALLILISVANIFSFSRAVANSVFWDLSLKNPFPPKISSSPISISEKRFEEVKKILPKSGEIGYETDRPLDWFPNQEKYVYRYYLAQYSLAPLILNPKKKKGLIILDYFQKKKVPNDYKLIKKFSNGIFIVKNDF